MFDVNSLPVPGGVVVAGITWAVISGFVLAPIVADRTIEKSGWHKICETNLRRRVAAQVPLAQTKPNVECRDVMKLLGDAADIFDGANLCEHGGEIIVDLLKFDPLAGQKEKLRQQEVGRLSRIAELAPSRCSCASSVVQSERISWGLFAGSARLIGGPANLQHKLTQALNSPVCAFHKGG